MVTVTTINSEGAFDSTVRNQINANFRALAGGTPQIVAAPAAANSAGVVGQIAYDTSYLYVCVATNTWLQVGIATWT